MHLYIMVNSFHRVSTKTERKASSWSHMSPVKMNSTNCSFRVGRKPALALTLILQVILGVSVSFSPNYITFAILRFLLGAVNIGVFTTAFVLGKFILVAINFGSF